MADDLDSVKLAFNVLLAVALVHFYPPKHHVRARRIIDEVLQEDPDNISCLVGLGYVQEYAKQWSEASETFARVVQLLPDDLVVGLRAKEELAWSRAQVADPDKGVKDLTNVVTMLDTLDDRDHDQARCWWRLGQCYWALGGARPFATRNDRSTSDHLTLFDCHGRSRKQRGSVQVLCHFVEAARDVCTCVHISRSILRRLSFTT